MLANFLVWLAANLIAKPAKNRYREQWYADLEAAKELGLSRTSIAWGAFTFALRRPIPTDAFALRPNSLRVHGVVVLVFALTLLLLPPTLVLWRELTFPHWQIALMYPGHQFSNEPVLTILAAIAHLLTYSLILVALHHRFRGLGTGFFAARFWLVLLGIVSFALTVNHQGIATWGRDLPMTRHSLYYGGVIVVGDPLSEYLNLFQALIAAHQIPLLIVTGIPVLYWAIQFLRSSYSSATQRHQRIKLYPTA